MITVFITVDCDDHIKAINSIDTNAYFEILDERYKKGKRDAWLLKNKYGAKLNPFIEIQKDGEFLGMIYSEASSDPLKELETLINNLNENKSN